MAEPLKPAATKTYGKENWIFVTTIASASLIPTALEVNAASSLDITNIAFADGAPSPSQSTNLVEQTKRFGDTTVSQFVGTTTYAGGEMTYQFAPQAAAASDGVKLWEKIPEGTTGYLVRRQGVAKATTPAAGQFVDVFPVEFGPSMPSKSGDGEAAETGAVVTFAVTATPAFKKALT